MNDFWNSGGALFVLFLILAPICSRLFRGILPRRSYESSGKRTPLTRKNLRRIAYGRRLRNICILIAAELAFVLLLYGIGRLRVSGAFGTLTVLLIYPVWYLYATLCLQGRPLRAALGYDGFEAELRGAELRSLAGGWQYIDRGWFICVSGCASAALCAEWIDFTRPVRIRIKYSGMSSGSKTGATGSDYRSTEYVFPGRDGTILRARMNVHGDIQKWIKDHGGRIEWSKD